MSSDTDSGSVIFNAEDAEFAEDWRQARELIADLIEGTDIARLDNHEVKRALGLPMTDFEDALVAAAAESAAATHIVTRNIADFRRSPVKAVTPEAFMRLVAWK